MPENRGTSFTLITQNVDGLSTTALSTVTSQSGSLNAQFNPTSSPSSSSQPPIIELHGRLLEMRCTNPDCSRRSLEAEWPVVPLPRGNSTGAPTSSSSSDLPHREFGLNLPRCEVCGSMCRPGDVWFGEQPLHGKEVKRIIDRCDFCIVVGTSSTVCLFLFFSGSH
jgi:NAD+-dependent protein deacetylase sirtuin 5